MRNCSLIIKLHPAPFSRFLLYTCAQHGFDFWFGYNVSLLNFCVGRFSNLSKLYNLVDWVQKYPKIFKHPILFFFNNVLSLFIMQLSS